MCLMHETGVVRVLIDEAEWAGRTVAATHSQPVAGLGPRAFRLYARWPPAPAAQGGSNFYYRITGHRRRRDAK